MKEKLKAMFCVWFGHSNIETAFWGYHYCARCGVQVGDSLGSVYKNDNAVIIGHECDICRENHKKLTWKDKILAPSPFKKGQL